MTLAVSLRRVVLAALALAPACGSDGSGGPGGADASTGSGGGDDAATGNDGSPPEPFIAVHSRTGIEGGSHGGDLVPGGMVAGHFDFPAGGLHTRIEGTMRIDVDPGEATSYFFAQQFWFADGDGGYMGLQTNGIIGEETVGKMLIFSIWDALDAEPGPGATCQPFGGEGVGQSCRLPFSWRPEVAYRLRLEATAIEDVWRVAVSSGDGPVVLGDIHVPSGWGLIEPTAAVFTEYYGPVAGCGTIPLAQAHFEDVSAGDGAVRPERADAEIYGTCAAAATASCSGDACDAI